MGENYGGVDTVNSLDSESQTSPEAVIELLYDLWRENPKATLDARSQPTIGLTIGRMVREAHATIGRRKVLERKGLKP